MSVTSATRSGRPTELLAVAGPPPHARSAQADVPALAKRPSSFRRAFHGLLRYLIAVGVGVGATLAWQSYGDAAKQLVGDWAAQHRWSVAWLSFGAKQALPGSPTIAAEPQSRPAVQAFTSDAAAAKPAPDVVGETTLPNSSDIERVEGMIATISEKVEQLATGQEQMASDIAKLKTAEQEIRQKISTAARLPPSGLASKPPTAPAPPSRPPMQLH